MKRRWLFLGMSLFLSGAMPAGPAHAQVDMFMQTDLVGKPAPDFTLSTTKADKVNFTQYRGGQNAIIFFWATWCPHCQEQLRELNEKSAQFAAGNVKLAIVDLSESKKQVEKYLKKNKIDLEVFLDKEGVLEADYQIIGVPTLYFVNKEGKVTAVRHDLPEDYQIFFNQ